MPRRKFFRGGQVNTIFVHVVGTIKYKAQMSDRNQFLHKNVHKRFSHPILFFFLFKTNTYYYTKNFDTLLYILNSIICFSRIALHCRLRSIEVCII